ncbi:hypothetical protein CXB51_010114 [Gossypium anomalum]|uniref:Uncharacterized protein n=1 Tax=Gossypium anomalum TaxID=47600 RepID=A0A8J6D1S5_9ROSI|nr:hypothetical protein CXB51_010114 [Gossypium anomalum]
MDSGVDYVRGRANTLATPKIDDIKSDSIWSRILLTSSNVDFNEANKDWKAIKRCVAGVDSDVEARVVRAWRCKPCVVEVVGGCGAREP